MGMIVYLFQRPEKLCGGVIWSYALPTITYTVCFPAFLCPTETCAFCASTVF